MIAFAAAFLVSRIVFVRSAVMLPVRPAQTNLNKLRAARDLPIRFGKVVSRSIRRDVNERPSGGFVFTSHSAFSCRTCNSPGNRLDPAYKDGLPYIYYHVAFGM